MGVVITTSNDGKLRTYSWDTWMGGTMHYFENIFQFRVGKTVRSVWRTSNEEKEDPNSWYSAIYSCNTGSRTIYIGVNHSVGSSMDKGGGIKLFTIENGVLVDDIKLIRTSGGLQNEINYYFDMKHITAKKDFPQAKFETRTKTILIPLISSDHAPTGRFIRYRFTGKYFEKVR